MWKDKQENTTFLDVLKRKFLVLVCFSIAFLVILHLLTDDTKKYNEYKNPLLKRKTELHQHSIEEQSQKQPPTRNKVISEDDNSPESGDDEDADLPDDENNENTHQTSSSRVFENDIPEEDVEKKTFKGSSFNKERNRIKSKRKTFYSNGISTEPHTKKKGSSELMGVEDKRKENYNIESMKNSVGDISRRTVVKKNIHRNELFGVKGQGIFSTEKNVNENIRDFVRRGITTRAFPILYHEASDKLHSKSQKENAKRKIPKHKRLMNKATSFKLDTISTNSGFNFRKNLSFSSELNFDCSYEGLGAVEETVNDQNAACIPYIRSKQDCNKAFEFFDKFDLNSEPVKCKKSPKEEPICIVKTLHRLSVEDNVNVECDPDICDGDEVLLGCRDINYGIIPKENSWQRFESVESLEEQLPSIIKKNSLNGLNFCFIKCASDRNEQPLVFPPLIKRARTISDGSAINVNIVVEDALSRPHFYRSLPKTVNTLRKLKRSKHSGVKVLDFELVQSYASFTVANMRALFTGKKFLQKGLGSDNRKNGVDEMMRKFKQQGYQTLIQEDLCFFDSWGTLLSEKYKEKLKPFTQKFKRTFQEYLNSTRYIDNRGLGHFPCEVLRTLGRTNPFRHLSEICSNGKFVGEYLLKYVSDFLRGVERRRKVAPAIAFTHLNTAHENTGIRVRGDDIPLANHIKTVSKLDNTITIIISDHGSKTTGYSISTFLGRLEVFSPIMFMIIPKAVEKSLGVSRVQNLLANQKRFVSLVDLQGMLNSIREISSAPAVMDYRVSGLLAPIPLNRTCSDLEGLKTDVYCRCKGWNRFINTKSHEVHWLAEIALGHINNIITEQFSKGRDKSDSSSIGYGACARFLGKSVERARQETSENYAITTLLLMVTPAYGADSIERFEVKLNHSSVGQPNVQVIDVLRVSVYGKYEACADRNVDVKLCACANKRRPRTRIRPRPDLQKLLSSKHFGLKTSVRFLSSRCLLFGERTLKTKAINRMQSRVVSFEVANQCHKRSFKLKVGGTSRRSLISRKLPFTLVIKPQSVVFLYAVDNAWKYGRFKPLVMLKED